MLIAVAERDEERFDRVWTWTREHLRRDDGLLSWRWKDGRVTDREPATDADLDAARALMLAAKRFDEPRYAEDGRALGRAVSEHETAQSVLVAGPWTQDVVNPSYWSPRAFAAIERVDLNEPTRRFTGPAHRRRAYRRTGRRSGRGAPCPPDRRRAATPSTRTTPCGCRSASPSRASRRTARSRRGCGRGCAIEPGAARRALDGTPLTGDEHPAALAGAAAAAHAAGDDEASTELLDRAEQLDAERPSYYGGAWVELTRAMLKPGALGTCG